MRLLVIAACLQLIATGVAFGQVVVVSSTSPSFKPGQIIAGDISIPDGGTVTLVANDGRTVTLRGPYAEKSGFESAQGGEGLVESLSSILSQSKGMTTLAVFRGSGPPDPWAVKVYRAGTYCVKTEAGVTLTRKRPHDQATLVIEPSGGGPVSVTWPRNESTLAWPAALEITDGGSYTIRFDGAASAVKVTLVVVPKDLPSDPHRADWIARNGCHRQAVSLLQSLQ